MNHSGHIGDWLPFPGEIASGRFAPYPMNWIRMVHDSSAHEAFRARVRTTVQMSPSAVLSFKNDVMVNGRTVFTVCLQSAMGRPLDWTNRSGWSERRPGDGDSGVRWTCITGLGHALSDEPWPKVAYAADHMLKGICDGERNAFIATSAENPRSVRHYGDRTGRTRHLRIRGRANMRLCAVHRHSRN